jgi:hypothetical protein
MNQKDNPGFTVGGEEPQSSPVPGEPPAPPPPEKEAEGEGPLQPEPKPLVENAFPTQKAALDFFNDRYMMVNDAGRALIFEQRHDPILHRSYFSHLRPNDFVLLYANRLVRVGEDKKGNPEYENAAKFWLTHPKRRQYLKGFVFHPAPGHDDPEAFNLWQGFAVEPKAGSWERLKSHLLHTVCQDSLLHYDYLINWMALMVQHPERQGQTCIVLIGPEGAGKSIVGDILRRILGQNGFVVSHAKHLTGNFNAHLRDIVFLNGNEAFYAGDKAHVSILKTIITDPVLTIEAKYRDTINVPNFIHLMLTANPGWVIPASIDARRFIVLTVSAECVGHFDYFKAIFDEMQSGGYEAMLHELNGRDISNFNVRDIPDSEGLQEQKKLSLPTPLAWWMDILDRGYVFASKLGLESYFGQWHEVITTELLFASYNEFAKAHGDRHPLPRNLFGRFMHKPLGGASCRPDDAVTGEHLVDVENTFGGVRREAKVVTQLRPRGFRLGTLTAAREAFAKHTKLTIEWGEDP